jgi:hypothetical protein
VCSVLAATGAGKAVLRRFHRDAAIQVLSDKRVLHAAPPLIGSHLIVPAHWQHEPVEMEPASSPTIRSKLQLKL